MEKLNSIDALKRYRKSLEAVIDEADRFRPHPFDPDLAVRALNRQGREGYRAFAAATRPNDDGLIRLRVHVRRD